MKKWQTHSTAAAKWYLDLRKSNQLLDDFVAQYNADRPLREQLRSNHVKLVQELLELYRIVLWKRQSAGELLIPGTILPYLATNNVQLCRRMPCTGRSIQNLRDRLQAAGLIQEEVWHGSNAAYEIALHPAILYITRKGSGRWPGAESVEQAVRERKAAAVWKSGESGVENGVKRQREPGEGQAAYGEKNAVFTEKLSPYCTLSFLDTNELNQLAVDRCGNRAEAGDHRAGEQRRNFLTGYETDSDECIKPPRVARRPPGGEVVRGEVVRGDVVRGEMVRGDVVKGDVVRGDVVKGDLATSTVGQGAGREDRDALAKGLGVGRGAGGQGKESIATLPQTFSETVAGLPQKLGRRIFREVSKVWEVAREELYAGEWIADTERERAKARLAEYYVDADPQRYVAGTAEICERIRLVRKWIDRGAAQSPTLSRWVPIPSVYFDYRNERGFRRTKPWFKQHMAKRQEIGDRIAVARAVQRYRRCLQGAEGSMGPVALYQLLQERLRERGKGVAAQFCAAVLG